MPAGEQQYVAGDGNQGEGAERVPVAPAIHDNSTRVRVNRAEQRLDRIVRSDCESGRTENLQVLRDEPHPHLLTGRNEHDRRQQHRDIAIQPEEARQARQRDHGCRAASWICR